MGSVDGSRQETHLKDVRVRDKITGPSLPGTFSVISTKYLKSWEILLFQENRDR
jgi:hypothetical protein